MALPHANFEVLEPVTVGTNTASHTFYDWKETLKRAGWTVKASGDGSALYSATTDVITVRGTGAGGVNALAWVRLQSPDWRELLWQLVQGHSAGSATAIQWRVKYSFAAGFTGAPGGGGSADANTCPSASDEIVYGGGGTDASPQGVSAFEGNANSTFNTTPGRSFGWAESISPFRFMFAMAQDQTPGGSRGGQCLDYCTAASSRGDLPDPDPAVVYMAGRSTNAYEDNELAPGSYSGAGTGTAGSGGFAHLTSGTPSASTIKEVQLNTYQDMLDVGNSVFVSGGRDLVPALWVRDDNQATPHGIKGFSSIFRWVMQGGSPINELYDVDGDGVYGDWIRLGDVAVPWIGTDPWSSFAGTNRNGILWFDPVTQIPGTPVAGAPDGLPEDIPGGFSLG